MRVLGFDPGVANYAWAVYEDGHVGDYGWLPGVRVGESDWDYLNALCEVLDRVRPDHVVCERFNYRTGPGGKSSSSVEAEHINVMIGKLELIVKMRGYKLDLIMPAHWKVKLGTKDLKYGAQDLFPEIKKTAWKTHQADAAGMARYIYDKLTTEPEAKPKKAKAPVKPKKRRKR